MVKTSLNHELGCKIFNKYFESCNHEIDTRNNNLVVKLPPVKMENCKTWILLYRGWSIQFTRSI